MRLIERGDVPLWVSPVLENVPGVRHGFTTRNGGVSAGHFSSLNLSVTVDDDPGDVAENRRRVAAAFDVDPNVVRFQTQVHRNGVVNLPSELPQSPCSGDAFISDVPGIPAIVGVADCVPVLLASSDGRVVAAVHAGWRGAVAGVVAETLAVLSDRCGVSPEDLRAAVGPAIGPCCFEVGEEVAEHFPERYVDTSHEKPHVDLPGFVAGQLVHAGLKSELIDRAEVCTMCRPDACFSHRGSGGRTGRMMAIIVRGR